MCQGQIIYQMREKERERKSKQPNWLRNFLKTKNFHSYHFKWDSPSGATLPAAENKNAESSSSKTTLISGSSSPPFFNLNEEKN